MRSLTRLLVTGLSVLPFAFWPSNAVAITVDVEQPAATVVGATTSFSATLDDVAGSAEIRWDFGDETETEFIEAQTSVQHTYERPGHYAVIVVARDDSGFSSRSFVHTVHTELAPGKSQTSSSIVYDPSRRLVIVANPDNDTITLVDSEGLAKVSEIPVFDRPVALALDPKSRLWVVHQDDFAVALVDLDERRVTAGFRLPYASQPMGVVFGPDDRAYLPLMAKGSLAVVDAESFGLEGEIEVGPGPRGIALSVDGSSLWTTRFISPNHAGIVTQVPIDDPDRMEIIELAEDLTTPDTDQQGRGLPNYLFSAFPTPDGRQVWIPGKKDNMARGLRRDGLALTQDNAVRPMIAIVDLEQGGELFDDRIDLDDRNLPSHVTFSPLGDYAFVSVYGSNLVEIRDTYSRDFVTALGNAGSGPLASVLAPTGLLFVHGALSRSVIVYDVGDVLSGLDQTTRRVEEIALVEHEALSDTALLGKQIFANANDQRMSQEGYLSCSSCHFEGRDDGRIWDFSDRGEGFRNTTSLVGRRGMGHGPVHWSGNFDEIQDFEGAIRTAQGGLGFLSSEQFNSGTVSEPLGDPKQGLSADLDALADYVGSLGTFPRSPFRTENGELTEAGRAGEQLFFDLECDGCHAGDAFTDSTLGRFYDVGTLLEESGTRLGEELTGIDTPTLLGVWESAPYLHDGSAPTLRDVLTTRNTGDLHGEVSFLSEEEIDNLVAYLQQIDPNEPPLPLVIDEPAGSGGAGGAATGGAATGGAGNPEPSGGSESGGTAEPGSTGGAPAGGAGSDEEAASPRSKRGCSVASTVPRSRLPRGVLWVLLLWCVRRASRHHAVSKVRGRGL